MDDKDKKGENPTITKKEWDQLRSQELIRKTQSFAAHNYAPYEVVIRSGEGVWVTDVDGRRYLDMLSAYSALNFGHCNPRLTRAAHAQLDRLTLTSRAFFSEEFSLLSEELAAFCKKDMVLLMNSGAEVVETAIKAARKWAYEKKGVAEDKAEILCFSDNFHGRTTTIVGFSTSPEARAGFGPFTPGFKILPFGNAEALAEAITPATAAVLVEPILGEGGVILPPDGFLRRVREIAKAHNVLMIADEIQTGLCRTGARFACDHEDVIPDLYLLAKSLGGGIVPISAVVGDKAVLDVFTPGTHGSTFGGNPFACAVAREVLKLIEEEKPEEKALKYGDYFSAELRALPSKFVTGIRSRGLMIGIDIDPAYAPAKKIGYQLKDAGLLCKDTRQQTLRLAPPLIISKEEIDHGLHIIKKVFCGS